MSDVQINLELVTNAFKKAIADSTAQGKQFADASKKSFSAVQASFAVMAGSLAAQGISKILGAISGSFNQMIDDAAASEQAIQNLNIALKQAGLFSKASSQELQDFASSLQNITIYGDDAVLASSALLLSLTNLDTQGVKKATQAAADLAATLNIDLGSATDYIAKAINGNVSQFQRMGITIQKGSTDAENLSNVLRALSTQEGAAEAATNTYTGARTKQTNSVSDFLKAIGKLITQNPLVIDTINASSAAFAEMAMWVTDNKKFISDLGTAVLISAGILAGGAATAAIASKALLLLSLASATGTTAFGALSIAASTAWAAITAPVTLVVAGIAAVVAITYQVVKNWDAIKISVYDALAATIEYAATAVSLLSDEKAAGLRIEAQAWRDKAIAIRESTEVEVESNKISDEQAAQRRKKLAEEASEVARINGGKAEQARIQNQNLLLIEEEKNIKLKEIEDGFAGSQLERRQAYETALLQLQIDSEISKAKLESDSKARTEALQAATDKAAIDKAKLRAKQEAEITANKVQNQKDTFSTIATLSNSNNKSLAAIGKAAGLVQIAIDTPVAVAKAYTLGPIAGPIAAGLIYTAMAAQAAQLVGVKFADGGIVPGTNNTGDRIQARLNSGEMVLNRNQQATLFKIANGGAATGSSQDNSRLEILVTTLIDVIQSQPVNVSIDGKELFSAVRDGTNSGRRIV